MYWTYLDHFFFLLFEIWEQIFHPSVTYDDKHVYLVISKYVLLLCHVFSYLLRLVTLLISISLLSILCFIWLLRRFLNLKDMHMISLQIVTKFYEVRGRDTGHSSDATLEEKCSCLLDDSPDYWIFSKDGESSSLKYIVNLNPYLSINF